MLAVGRKAESLKRFETALKLQPNSGGAHYCLAWIMATASEDELRNGRRAIEHARRAVQLMEGSPFTLDALAAAHAEVGEFAEAVKWEEKAIQNATGTPKSLFEARLARFKQQLPYRE